MSQFNYCPLVYMCHSRTLNNKINKLDERALRLFYYDRQSTFEELINIDKSVTIHHRNLQVLATELYKLHHGLAPELMNDVFNPLSANPTKWSNTLKQFVGFCRRIV